MWGSLYTSNTLHKVLSTLLYTYVKFSLHFYALIWGPLYTCTHLYEVFSTPLIHYTKPFLHVFTLIWSSLYTSNTLHKVLSTLLYTYTISFLLFYTLTRSVLIKRFSNYHRLVMTVIREPFVSNFIAISSLAITNSPHGPQFRFIRSSFPLPSKYLKISEGTSRFSPPYPISAAKNSASCEEIRSASGDLRNCE